MKRKKKKFNWQQCFIVLFYALIGVACGVLISVYMKGIGDAEQSWEEIIVSFFLLLIGTYAAMFIQIVIHEAGHLLFGLLTGYRFSSFRIGSFMWIKENGTIHFRRLSLAGTGGQCLMAPPDRKDGTMPFFFYNLGGSILNICSAVIFVILGILLRNVKFMFPLCMIVSLIGIAFALMNGIPMRFGMVDNDGYNALSLGKNPKALRAFWIQMKVNEQAAKGVRTKDMPEEWFEMPSEEEMKNGIIATVGVFACERQMADMEFETADCMMEKLLCMDTGMIDLHRKLLKTDRIFCELVGKNRPENLKELFDEDQKKFMKAMEKYPSVLRTEYAYALLAEKNPEKGKQIRTQFEKSAKNFPYPVEIAEERELIEYAKAVFNRC